MTCLRNVVGVLVLSSCLISRVLAAVNTGPWEGSFLWYAYRMDIEAFGIRDDMIAPLCPATRTDGTCNFDDFIKYIQNQHNALDPNQHTIIGENLWPDAATAANELSQLTIRGGNPYKAQFDPSKLFKSGKFGPGTPLATMMEEALNRIQAARTQFGDTSDKVKPGLTQAREALTRTQQERLESTAKGNELFDALEKYKAEKGLTFTVEYDNFTFPDGEVGKMVNLEKMALQSDWENNLKGYLTWIATKKGNQNPLNWTRMHSHALFRTQDQAARLRGPPSC